METRIVTRHPDPNKEGANISKDTYDIIKEAILNVLEEVDSMKEDELPDVVKGNLDDEINGDIAWYIETVKLDLLARDLIEHEPGKPTHIREKTFY